MTAPTQAEAIALLPCAHCGSADIEKWSNSYDAWIVMCSACGCSTSGDHSEVDAIAAWNRRAASIEPPFNLDWLGYRNGLADGMAEAARIEQAEPNRCNSTSLDSPIGDASGVAQEPAEAVYFMRQKCSKGDWVETSQDNSNDECLKIAFDFRTLYAAPQACIPQSGKCGDQDSLTIRYGMQAAATAVGYPNEQDKRFVEMYRSYKSAYECECARMTKARELLAKAMYNMAQHDIARSVQVEITEFLEGK